MKITLNGGKTLYSSLMTLVVGCQSTGTKWTEAANNDKVIAGGSSTSKVYRFNPPTINNTYCTIGSYSVVNVVNSQMTPSTHGIHMSATCISSDCLDLDLNSTGYNQTIKF